MNLPCAGSITHVIYYIDITELTSATRGLSEIEHLNWINVLILILFSVLKGNVIRLNAQRRGNKALNNFILVSSMKVW